MGRSKFSRNCAAESEAEMKRKRTNKPGAGRPVTKGPRHQIAPRVSELAYRNYLAIPEGKRSDLVSEKLEELDRSEVLETFHVKQSKPHFPAPYNPEILRVNRFELPPEPLKSELLELMETEIKNIRPLPASWIGPTPNFTLKPGVTEIEVEEPKFKKPTNWDEMGPSERAYFESLNEQTSETDNETNTHNDPSNPK